jgi:hypothetical protein
LKVTIRTDSKMMIFNYEIYKVYKTQMIAPTELHKYRVRDRKDVGPINKKQS